MKILRALGSVISYLSHLLPLTLIYFALQPIASWYFSKVPILGVDFYNSASFASILSKNLHFPASVFIDNWYAGYPLHRIFVSTHWYTMIPFINEWGIVRGIQIYVLLGLFLLIAASYLLYFSLSKSRALSLLLAFLVMYSVNIYGAAVWGGSLPYFATQFFFPLVLFLIYKYVSLGDKRWFLIGILTTGVGFMAHPMSIFGFVLPAVAILIFFGLNVNERKKFKNLLVRIRQIFIFALGSLLVGLPVSYERIIHTFNAFISSGPVAFFSFIAPIGNQGGSTTSEGTAATQEGIEQIQKFYQGLTNLLYTDTNQLLFVFAAIGIVLFLISLVFIRRKLVIQRVLPFVLIALYCAGHTIANAYGFTFIPQGWYRAFWTFPVAVGALTAVTWGIFFQLMRDKLRFKNTIASAILVNVPFAIFAIIFAYVGYMFFTIKSPEIINIVDTKSEISSAHPEALSIQTTPKAQAELKELLIPDFIDPNEKNKRLYESDALVNVWWSAFFDMPMVRGYVDPPLATSQRGSIFWLDIAIGNDSLVRDFKVPEETAFNNALFLIDWNAIYYYEGGRFGISASVPPSSYLLKNNVFEKEATTAAYGALIKWQTPSGKPELNMEIPQYLRFYKVRDELTSPVLYPTQAPTILVFTDESGYENVMRGFAVGNLNSTYVIPVNAGKYIDDYSLSELSKFQGIILHSYNYHNKNKAFDSLKKYIEKGGKVFIDTGAESPDSDSKDLPEIFPFKSTVREGLGKSWEIQAGSDSILNDIKVNEFSPLIFDEDEWKLSYSEENSVKDGSIILLSQKGKPVLVKRKIGSGELIWSGMNLLYHYNQYKNEQEGKLFLNIARNLVAISKNKPIDAKAAWLSPEKVTLSSTASAKGVLFKEQFYDGWSAKMVSPDKKGLKIYKAGPTYPGFMYVPVSTNGPYEISFNYKGNVRSYFIYIFTIVLIIFILDNAIFSGFLTKRVNFFKQFANKKATVWWEKEDE